MTQTPNFAYPSGILFTHFFETGQKIGELAALHLSIHRDELSELQTASRQQKSAGKVRPSVVSSRGYLPYLNGAIEIDKMVL